MLLYKLNQLSSIQYTNNTFVFSVQHVYYQHEHNFDVEMSVVIASSVKLLKIIQKIEKCSAVCTNALLFGWVTVA